LVRAPDS